MHLLSIFHYFSSTLTFNGKENSILWLYSRNSKTIYLNLIWSMVRFCWKSLILFDCPGCLHCNDKSLARTRGNFFVEAWPTFRFYISRSIVSYVYFILQIHSLFYAFLLLCSRQLWKKAAFTTKSVKEISVIDLTLSHEEMAQKIPGKIQ